MPKIHRTKKEPGKVKKFLIRFKDRFLSRRIESETGEIEFSKKKSTDPHKENVYGVEAQRVEVENKKRKPPLEPEPA